MADMNWQCNPQIHKVMQRTKTATTEVEYRTIFLKVYIMMPKYIAG